MTSNSANGAMLSARATEIETFSGQFVDVANPDPATLRVEDIAQGLSLTCRYGGQVTRFYSVAEHAVLVHDLLRWQGADRPLLLVALFHDAAEAYLGDVVAPLKFGMRYTTQAEDAHYMGGWPPDGRCRSAYDVLSDRMDAAIVARFGLDAWQLEHSDALRAADMWALRIEARELTHTGGREWRWPGVFPNGGELPESVKWSGGVQPPLACRRWLNAVASYIGELS